MLTTLDAPDISGRYTQAKIASAAHWPSFISIQSFDLWLSLADHGERITYARTSPCCLGAIGPHVYAACERHAVVLLCQRLGKGDFAYIAMRITRRGEPKLPKRAYPLPGFGKIPLKAPRRDLFVPLRTGR